MDKDSLQAIMELSSPVYSLATDLEQYPRDFNTVLAEIEAHLQYKRRELEQRGLSEAQVDAIVYATAALVDEIIMRSSWTQKAAWSRRPLCVRLFNDARAGHNFFERVHALRAAPVTNALPLWHYWRCIQLGFQGQYRGSDGRSLRDVVLSLESGLAEAGFTPATVTEPQPDIEPSAVFARPAWPLHRYVLLSALIFPLLIFTVSDLILFGTFEQLHDFVLAHAERLQTTSRFITP